MRIVCGLDVHKDSIFLCIMSSTGEIFEKKYGVLTNQLEEMRDLMLTYHVQEVGMESTSVYWVPVWRILEPHFKLKLINPYFIKQLPGHKSDVKDAQCIASSNSFAQTILKPARSKPKSRPPHPAKRETMFILCYSATRKLPSL